MNSLRFLSQRTQDVISKFENKYPIHAGYFYSTLSNFFFAVCALLVRKYRYIPAFQIYYYRGLIIFLLCFLLKGNLSFCPKELKVNRMLLLRGIIGIGVGGLAFYGFQKAPLGEGMAINLTAPVITGIMAKFILGEKYDIVLILSSIFSLAGVILITKPEFIFAEFEVKRESEITGYVILLISAFCSAAVNILLKKLATKTDPKLATVYFSVFSCCLSPIIVYFQGMKENIQYNEGISFIVIGVLSFFGMILLARSMMFGNAGNIALMGYSQILFSLFFGYYLLDDVPDKFGLIGALLIFLCVVFRVLDNLRK